MAAVAIQVKRSFMRVATSSPPSGL